MKKLCDENRFKPSIYDQAIHLAFDNHVSRIEKEAAINEEMALHWMRHTEKQNINVIQKIFADRSFRPKFCWCFFQRFRSITKAKVFIFVMKITATKSMPTIIEMKNIRTIRKCRKLRRNVDFIVSLWFFKIADTQKSEWLIVKYAKIFFEKCWMNDRKTWRKSPTSFIMQRVSQEKENVFLVAKEKESPVFCSRWFNPLLSSFGFEKQN